MNCVDSIPFARNSYFSMFVHRLRCLRTLFDYVSNRLIIFQVEFNNRKYGRVPISHSLFSLFGKQKFDVRHLKLKKSLNHVWQFSISTKTICMRYPCYAPVFISILFISLYLLTYISILH